MLGRKPRQSHEDAEIIGMRALAFLATDPERLGRFLALTGMGPADLAAAAREPAFAAEILGYLVTDESALLAFAADASLDPAMVVLAESQLRGP